MLTRRDAIKQGTAAALTAQAILPATALGRGQRIAPNSKIALGLIGAGGMGSANMRQCLADPGTTLAAVCDVQRPRVNRWTNDYPEAKPYADYRDLLADPNVDAVIIATPPHWHCLQAVEAAAAGKHIYLQKPMTLYPAESIAVRNAVRRHGVICQVGTQIHQGDNYRRVVDWIRTGQLGPIGRVETFWGWNMGKDGIGTAPIEPAPEGVDFDMFCGPAPLCDFNRSLITDGALHCSFWDYSGGWTLGMAPHIIDLPIWAMELGLPEKISSFGGRYITGGDGDAPDTQDIVWQYPNLTMRWHFSLFNHHAYEFGSAMRTLGIYFHGLNGTLRTNYNQREIISQSAQLDPTSEPPGIIIPSGFSHEHEWLNCIRTGTQPSCNPEYHIKVDLPLTLGNLSYTLGRTIQFDPVTESIIDDPEAARKAIPNYRSPWKFPAAYLNPA